MTLKEKQMAAGTASPDDDGETTAGASFHDASEWHGILWYSTERNVRRLQARIVKATQEMRWGKVKALQRLLTRSLSGKALAVRRVTENQGKKTPGVDKIIWDTPEKKAQAIHDLRQRGYHPQPLRRVYIVRFVPLKRLTKPGKGVRSMTDLNNFRSKEVREQNFLPLPLR
jgi:RNA-directed DNA polymerase